MGLSDEKRNALTPCKGTKTVLDSGFHAVDSGFQISCQWTLDSGFHHKWDSGFIGLNSGFQSTGFQIPGTKICQILGSG